MPNKVLGYIFLGATVLLYAGIGFMSKTAYYVAGRRVPAPFNGMAGTLCLLEVLPAASAV